MSSSSISVSFHAVDAVSRTDPRVRLAVDVGGTFTDVVLLRGEAKFTAKVLTTPGAPEQAVLGGIGEILQQAALGWADVDLLILGTTLATNALIERKGARTALVTTEGFRAEALGGDERGARALALDEGVGGQRGTQDQQIDVGPAERGLLQDLPDAAQHGLLGRAGRGQHLGGELGLAAQQHDVGEGAAHVDG